MTKQEKIQEAWGGFYDKVKENLTSEGYCNITKMPHNIDLWDGKWDNYSTYYRPIELSGLATNNGWIKIESEDDLPKDEIDCFFTKGNQMFTGIWDNGLKRFYSGNNWISNVFHYQEIKRPDLPLY